MRPLTLITVFALFVNLAFSQNSVSNYNKRLADSLGADEYGMRWYVMVVLKSGTKKISKDSVGTLYREHMDFINELSQSGKLILTGPLGKNEQDYRNIFLINSVKIDEAQKLLSKNPAIRFGLFNAEYFFWYTSAALPTYKKQQVVIELKKP